MPQRLMKRKRLFKSSIWYEMQEYFNCSRLLACREISPRSETRVHQYLNPCG